MNNTMTVHEFFELVDALRVLVRHGAQSEYQAAQMLKVWTYRIENA